MTYILLKAVHVACVALAVLLLLARLSLASTGRDYRRCGPLRWIPHAVDTVLLLSAGLLAWHTAQYPFVQPWLTAKVLALPVYVIAGAVALDVSRRPRMRVTAAILALALVAYIVAVAFTRDPIPF